MRRTMLELAPIQVVGPSTINADVTSSTIDLIDAGGNELVISTGIGGITFDSTNKIDIKVTHSDDDVTYVPVKPEDVIIDGDDDILLADVATGNVKTFNVAKPATSVTRVGYVGARRYLKVFLDFAGTHGTGTPFSVLLVQTRPHIVGKA